MNPLEKYAARKSLLEGIKTWLGNVTGKSHRVAKGESDKAFKAFEQAKRHRNYDRKTLGRPVADLRHRKVLGESERTHEIASIARLAKNKAQLQAIIGGAGIGGTAGLAAFLKKKRKK